MNFLLTLSLFLFFPMVDFMWPRSVLHPLRMGQAILANRMVNRVSNGKTGVSAPHAGGKAHVDR
jgi:hypothetical protein